MVLRLQDAFWIVSIRCCIKEIQQGLSWLGYK